MSKETIINQENNKSAEIEAIFKKVEKIPYGEIFVSIFKENTIAKSRELIVENRGFPDKKVMGVIQKETGFLPPAMVLSVVPEGSLNKNDVELEIFDSLIDANIGYHPSIRFYAGEDDRIGCMIDCKLSLRPFDDTKQSDRGRLFIKIISEVSSRISQFVQGDEDAGKAGSRPTLF